MRKSQQTRKTRNEIKGVINLSLPGSAEWIKIPRVVTSVITERMSFNKDDAEDISLAMGEACANVVQHAYDKNKESKMGIKFFIYPNKLIIFLKDKGKGFIFNAEDSPCPDKEGRLGKSGRGIAIIKKTMDKYKFDSFPNKGTTLKMVKYKR